MPTLFTPPSDHPAMVSSFHRRHTPLPQLAWLCKESRLRHQKIKSFSFSGGYRRGSALCHYIFDSLVSRKTLGGGLSPIMDTAQSFLFNILDLLADFFEFRFGCDDMMGNL